MNKDFTDEDALHQIVESLSRKLCVKEQVVENYFRENNMSVLEVTELIGEHHKNGDYKGLLYKITNW